MQNNLLIGFLTLLGLGIFHPLMASNEVLFETTGVDINGTQHEIEIAKTAIQRQHGLMFRKHLAGQAGMLFIYPEAGFHRIWMKNTLIPLTVVWIDNHQTVIHIARLDPCLTLHCPSFGADKPAKYIIELAAGSRSLGLGDRVSALANFEAKE